MTDQIQTETSPEGVSIVALGEKYENLNEHLLQELQTFLLNVAGRADPPLMVLDLSHTKFFGSAFLEVLFRVWNCLKKSKEGRFALCGLTDYCAEVVETTHLERVWTVATDRDAAVKALLTPE